MNPNCHDKIEVLTKKNIKEVNKMLKEKLAKIDENSEDMKSESNRPITADSEVLQRTPSLKDELMSDGSFIEEDEVK